MADEFGERRDQQDVWRLIAQCRDDLFPERPHSAGCEERRNTLDRVDVGEVGVDVDGIAELAKTQAATRDQLSERRIRDDHHPMPRLLQTDADACQGGDVSATADRQNDDRAHGVRFTARPNVETRSSP
jgi:hypothetical protein